MKNEAWLVTARTVMKRPREDDFEFSSNTIVRGEHPVAWAARNSVVTCKGSPAADGFIVYLLFYAELSAEVADAAEASSWCEVSYPKGERP